MQNLTRISVLGALLVLLNSCAVPLIPNSPEWAVIRGEGLARVACSRPAQPPQGEPLQWQTAAKPGPQDMVVCIRASYSMGVGTLTQNDKFAVMRANLKPNQTYLVKVNSVRDTTKSRWTAPQNEFTIENYELVEEATQKVIARGGPGIAIDRREEFLRFIVTNNVAPILRANTLPKR
jgi:hypothetical protein